MTTPYVPVPAPLPSSIALPQDVVDDVIVGTVNPPLQQLADAIAYQGVINETFFQAQIKATSYTSQRLKMEIPNFGTNISLVGDDEILISKAGYYLVQFKLFYGLSSIPITEISQLGIYRVGDTAFPKLSGASVVDSPGGRISNSFSGIIQAGAGNSFFLYPVYDDAITLTVTPVDEANSISIVRIQ